MSEFFATSGSIVGREHRRVHRNNQDAVGLRWEGGTVLGVVADGCSAGRYSEVGARLGAGWLSRWLPRYLRLHGNVPALAEAVTEGLVSFLGTLAHALQPSVDELEAAIADHLLFTWLAVVVGAENTQVFGIGEGLVCVNGHRRVIEPAPGNHPPYVAYRLLRRSIAPVSTRPVLHYRAPTRDVRSIIVATDGAAEIADLTEFTSEDRYIRNPFLLQRRLNALGQGRPSLADDTSLILIRRCVEVTA